MIEIVKEKKDIKSLNYAELSEALTAAGQPRYRAGQVYKWLQAQGVREFSEMTDIPLSLRCYLDDNFVIFTCDIEKKFHSVYDNTIRYLYKLSDGEKIESVLMEYKYGYTACISTQAGCRMGCSFCATGYGGFRRNLTASEMLSQLHAIEHDTGVRISHVVLMGMGEPLDNFDNVMRFLALVSDDRGLHIGMRNLSLSTCGLVDKIYLLMERNLQLTLSVSLHAPTDEIRSKMMPVNKKWNISELLKACRAYAKETSRRISFEYALVSGVNDSDDCARILAGKLKGMLCHVNLIPVNPVAESGYSAGTRASIERFQKILADSGIQVTVRRTLGADIAASCGQLRGKE